MNSIGTMRRNTRYDRDGTIRCARCGERQPPEAFETITARTGPNADHTWPHAYCRPCDAEQRATRRRERYATDAGYAQSARDRQAEIRRVRKEESDPARAQRQQQRDDDRATRTSRTRVTMASLHDQEHLTGVAIAAHLGVDPATVSRWRTGRTVPDQPTLDRLIALAKERPTPMQEEPR